MKLRSVYPLSLAIFAITACSPAANEDAPAQTNDAVVTDDVVLDAAADTACPVLESRNWQAWVDAMPGPDSQPMLRVTGDVDMPTPGYFFEWREGAADRSATPVQRLHLSATPPDGMSAQVITTEAVRYDGAAITKTYGGIMVLCGDEVLADITDVTVAE